MLEARLEGLACVGERSPGVSARLELQVSAVAAATRRAIALELISADEADAIWAQVAARHPGSAWCQAGPLAA